MFERIRDTGFWLYVMYLVWPLSWVRAPLRLQERQGSTRPRPVASGAAAAAQSAAAGVSMVPTGILSGVAVSRPEATGRAAAGLSKAANALTLTITTSGCQ